MPILQANNISHQFSNGESIFRHLSCSMNHHRVGLVGRNGVGKSLLASILSGEISPTEGVVQLPNSYGVYRQHVSDLQSSNPSIADVLQRREVLDALKRVAAGDCSTECFDIIGDEWELELKLYQRLAELDLPADPYFPCARLSGGQLARLQLWQLFEQAPEVLILDEPSNHLDARAKQWLMESMRAYPGAILLLSHDRQLLRQMGEIWELSSLGLEVFGGNYDFYAQQKRIELEAVDRQVARVEKQQRALAQQTQNSREKAQQREAQGNRLRKDGSQSKLILNRRKDSATARASNRNKNSEQRRALLQRKASVLKSKQEILKGQAFYFAEGQSESRNAIAMTEAVLPFGCAEPISLHINRDEKVHLQGDNGCGKSTLLKVLRGDTDLQRGELRVNTSFYYLDQHFACVKPQLSVLDNVLQQCAGMHETTARTLLAGIGFRHDAVFRPSEVLSGGEKMKLAMLIVSHQVDSPLLLLDEPDNHLDLGSKIRLAQALDVYQGGFILVSHDADFAAECGVKRQLMLG